MSTWFMHESDTDLWRERLQGAGYDVVDVPDRQPESVTNIHPRVAGLIVVNRSTENVRTVRDPNGKHKHAMMTLIGTGAVHNAGVGYTIRATQEAGLPVYITGEAPPEDMAKYPVAIGNVATLIGTPNQEQGGSS